MQPEKNNKMPRFFIIISAALGLLLAAFSIASGSNPLIQPDWASIQQQLKTNPVSSEQLAGWMVEGKRDFRVAGFRSTDECKDQKKMSTTFKCYDSQKIKDSFWVRKTFKNMNMPLIVFGNQTEDSLSAAAQLKHLGYDVRYLEEGFNGFSSRFLNPNQEIAQNDSSIRYITGNDPLVKVKGQQWMMAKADNMMEEEAEGVELGEDDEEEEDDYEDEDEDEEEEEGC